MGKITVKAVTGRVKDRKSPEQKIIKIHSQSVLSGWSHRAFLPIQTLQALGKDLRGITWSAQSGDVQLGIISTLVFEKPR